MLNVISVVPDHDSVGLGAVRRRVRVPWLLPKPRGMHEGRTLCRDR